MYTDIKRQAGAALLIMTLILMLAAGLMLVYGSSYGILQEKTANNQQDANKAMAAAEAGLDYAIAFLSANASTVTGSQSGGNINYTIATTTQSDNSTYSISITNPTTSDYKRLQVTSTGTSPDGTSQRIVRQEVYSSGSSVQYAVTTKQNLNMSGNSSIEGTYGVNAGGSVSQSGSSSASNVNDNDSSLSTLTDAQFFNKFFGASTATVQANSAYYATQLSVPWSTVSGNVWVDSSVVMAGDTTIGSPTSPVVLIVNGSFTGLGNITIYGLVYTMSNTSLTSITGSVNVIGGVVSEGNISTSGNSTITYDENVLGQLPILGSGSSYAKIPGSWYDF